MQKKTANTAELAKNEVHIWQLDLTEQKHHSKQYKALLSTAERNKINRLRNPVHQTRSLAMRAQLRLLLANYLQLEPGLINFETTEFGKPYIIDSAFSFNVSHSEDSALVVISNCAHVGVDIEHWRTLDNLQGVVDRNFSDDEKKDWKLIAENQREAVFFDIWTRKEAFIKATGRGLGMGLSRCGFSLRTNGQLIHCPIEYGAASEWSCASLQLGERVSATVMLKADSCQPVIYKFEPEFSPSLS
tara:strand:- start:16851 stop:17585 length:735 start_codon:yes stop_codon:yes gene_type:complete